jgi:uncharacterized membrane protein YjdF
MMNKKHKLVIYLLFMQIYVIFAVFNYLKGSQWVFDSILAMIFLTFMFIINKWLKLEKFGFVLFNIALLSHNLGTFGFYDWRWGIFAYDNIVHLLNSMVGAYIIFNFVARKLHIRERQRVKFTVVDEHKIIFIFLVLASVAMLGAVVEIIEFLGFMYLGPGEGILFFGAGDSGNVDDIAGQYIDTMGDIIVNTIGTIIGVILYYNVKYKKQPWLRC